MSNARLGIGLLCSSFGVSLLTTTAHAAEPHLDARITTSTAAGADDCPDSAQLEQAVQQARAGGSPRVLSSYRVEFSVKDGRYVALIRPESSPEQERRIESQEKTCVGLSQAVIVSLSLMIDAQAPLPPPPTPVPVKPAPAPKPTPVAKHSATPPALRSVVEAGAGVALGLLDPLAPILEGRFSLSRRQLGLTLGVAWVPAQTHDLTPGRVEVDWRGAYLLACWLPLTAVVHSLQVDICAGFSAGWFSARAAGFDRNTAEQRLALMLPVDLKLASKSLRWGQLSPALALGMWLPLKREAFVVTGAGSAYEPPPLAGMLRVLIAFDL